MRYKKRPAMLLTAATLLLLGCIATGHSGPVMFFALTLIAGCLQQLSRQ
jgi:hypothetical protein